VDFLLTPRTIPLIIVIGAPVAGAVITLAIKGFKPDVRVTRTWVITTYVLMVVQAVGMFFALPS